VSSSATAKFVTLDGLRGVAALVVLFFHVGQAMPGLPIPGTPYLAVDLFFMLSGFVIGHAYHQRLASGMGFRRFLEVRWVRLYPLYFLGSLIGLAVPVIVALASQQHWTARPAVEAIPWAVAMLPVPDVDPYPTFILNPPAWSLCFEMIVNIGYGLLFRFLSQRTLVGLVAVSGALHLAGGAYTELLGNTLPGWWWLTAFLRTLFPFSVGLLINRLYRSGALPRVKMPAVLIVAFFLGLILLPSNGALGWLVAEGIVILGFPAVVILGVMNEPGAIAAPAMRISGDLSYPLYVLHWPILLVLVSGGGLLAVGPGTDHLLLVAPVAIAAAWLADRYYDRPVRAWAGRRLAARRAIEAAPAL